MQPSKSTQPSTDRGRAAAGRDAVQLLIADHREVKSLFTAYEKLAENKAPADDRQLMATQICVLLTLHTHIEEEIFYPAARQALDEEGDDLLNEAEVEHAGAKNLIRELKAMQASDEMYDAKVKVLGEMIDHHVGEEENELFPKVKRTSLDLAELGDRMDARKKELLASPQPLEPLPNELPH